MQVPKLKMITLLAGIGLLAACTKNSNPKTIYDTVTVTKTDTLQLPPPDDTPNLTTGLVLYLPFTNGSYADSSGLNNAVTAVNGATLGYDMHGYAQSAFTESSNNAVLTVANNGNYAVDTGFSVSLDFMLRSLPYWNGTLQGLQELITLMNYNTGYGPTFVIGFNSNIVPESFIFDVNPSTSDCDTVGNSQNHFAPTNFTPQVGAWYNAICIFSHGTGYIYINGQLISTQSITGSSVLFCPSSTLIIGGCQNGSEPLNGEIDNLRMYNRTLTAQQIAWLARNFQTTSTSQRPVLRSGKTMTVK
jgi:hypothetical protein